MTVLDSYINNYTFDVSLQTIAECFARAWQMKQTWTAMLRSIQSGRSGHGVFIHSLDFYFMRVHQCSCSSPRVLLSYRSGFGRYESPDFCQEEMPGDGEEDDLMYQEPEIVGLGQVVGEILGSCGVDFFL